MLFVKKTEKKIKWVNVIVKRGKVSVYGSVTRCVFDGVTFSDAAGILRMVMLRIW